MVLHLVVLVHQVVWHQAAWEQQLHLKALYYQFDLIEQRRLMLEHTWHKPMLYS